MKKIFQQTWWDTIIHQKEDSFLYGIGGSEAVSKVFSRNYIMSRNYKSLIDIGCGPSTEFFAYKEEGYEINYLGVDSSNYFFNKNRENGVPMHLSPAEFTNLPSNCADIVFSRHVLEHQPSFQPILDEMIRLAKIEALHIFFFIPWEYEQESNYDEAENLWHTTYSRKDIENYLCSHPKVKEFEWRSVPHKEPLAEGFTPEVMLHIFLKDTSSEKKWVSDSFQTLVIQNIKTGKKISLEIEPNDEFIFNSYNFISANTEL